MPESNDVPDPLVNFDQTLASMRDLARLMRGYYEGLEEAGFATHEALMMTVAYQNALASKPNA